MSKKRIIATAFVIILACAVCACIFLYQPKLDNQVVQLDVTIESTNIDEVQYYYTFGSQPQHEYVEEQKGQVILNTSADEQVVMCNIPIDSTCLRMDFGTEVSEVCITDIEINSGNDDETIPFELWQQIVLENDVKADIGSDNIVIETQQGDPYIAWDISQWGILDSAINKWNKIWTVMKCIECACVVILAIIAILKADKLFTIPLDLYRNRKIVWNLAKNDFKTKYAGSYLGIFWAFVQPLVTTAVYWFVFQVGLKSGQVSDFPFVLWLMSGLVPWFFFQEGIMGGTNALLEYNYLVKKVVFDIDILPIVKVCSAFFVHLFFIMFIMALCACYGYFPNVYTLQVVYLLICNFVLVLGLSYLTSAMVGFARDLTQIINIVLQIGMWITPIMWNVSILQSPILKFLMKLNPMYYIVEGFRAALLAKEWIIGNVFWTVYFWIVTLGIWMLGVLVFKKLKIHFADVL